VLQRVEADEHGIRGQQQMLVAAALCALPGELHRIDENQSRRCPAASAVDCEWFSGEAGHVRKRRRVKRDRRWRVEFGGCGGDEREIDPRVVADRHRDVGCEGAHPRIQKLLDADDQRRARQAESRYPTFDDPAFETSFEKRRLRVLNSLLRALDRLSVDVSIDGREARTLVAHVGDFSVGFTIDGVSAKTASTRSKGVSGPMRCQLMALCGGEQPIETWTDVEGQALENRLGDIAVAIVVHGERVCRSSAQHHRDWVIQRKAEIAEEERRKEAERRRLERERLERLEKARVGRLLAQAKSLREAEEIRAYVSAVRERQAALDGPLSATGFQQWADWALSQADRIDPVLSGSFRTVQDDD